MSKIYIKSLFSFSFIFLFFTYAIHNTCPARYASEINLKEVNENK